MQYQPIDFAYYQTAYFWITAFIAIVVSFIGVYLVAEIEKEDI